MIYYNYISLYSFLILVFYVFLETESFIPAARSAHSSVLVGNKLYFFGGITSSTSCSNVAFYLDVFQPFNMTTLPWNELTANEGMPIKSCWGTVSLSEVNNEQSIYLFGGVTQDITTNQDSPKSLVYKLNLKSGLWEMPVTKGKMPERRREMNAVSDISAGKIYIFGGVADDSVGSSIVTYFNDIVTFNVGELSWSISYQANQPAQRALYTATLLSNGVIVYIGGYGIAENMTEVVGDISEINLYDTKSSTWSVQTTKVTGQIESRRGHTAVLAPDDKIIIYGGENINNFRVIPNTAILNTKTFEWTIPSESSNIGTVPSLTLHTANLVGNYMIVAFGNITQPNAAPTASSNANIYVMDIRNYTWVNTFEPENTSTKPSESSTPDTSDDEKRFNITMKLVVGTVSGIVLLIMIGFFGYLRYQRERVMRVHGNTQKQP